MGQKVMASIVLRISLAEIFCPSYTFLLLDEPSANLDHQNSNKLVDFIKQLIKNKEEENFQLFVISHDPVSLDKLTVGLKDTKVVQVKRVNEIGSKI